MNSAASPTTAHTIIPRTRGKAHAQCTRSMAVGGGRLSGPVVVVPGSSGEADTVGLHTLPRILYPVAQDGTGFAWVDDVQNAELFRRAEW